MVNYIWIGRKKYYYYDTYKTKKQAVDMAKILNMANKKNKTYIMKTEEGYLYPKIVYKLYNTKYSRFMYFG